MSAIAISCIVFAWVFGGAVLGLLSRRVLPEDHFNADSKDAIKVAMGLVATMSALVLGLLVSSAKSFYDTQNAELTEMSAKVILLDRVLAHYGPEAKEVRDLLRSEVADSLERIWPRQRSQGSEGTLPSGQADVLFDRVQALSPTNDTQRTLQAEAISMGIGLGQIHWLMYEQGSASISKPLLVAMVFWLTALFFSFGLFAPRNTTVTAALFVAALSVSGAIFLIMEMYGPYRGMIQISDTPLRFALAHLGQ